MANYKSMVAVPSQYDKDNKLFSEYQIEKEKKPIPPISSRQRKYPFKIMEIGDSFSVPLSARSDRPDRAADLIKVSILGSARRKRFPDGRLFCVRTEKEEGVVRCWRIK